MVKGQIRRGVQVVGKGEEQQVWAGNVNRCLLGNKWGNWETWAGVILGRGRGQEGEGKPGWGRQLQMSAMSCLGMSVHRQFAWGWGTNPPLSPSKVPNNKLNCVCPFLQNQQVPS